MVRIGLLGCGRIACMVHLPLLLRDRSVDLAVVADSDPERLAIAGRAAPRARVASDWRAVVDDPAIEAVVVCLPSGLHAGAARAALDSGKHAYVEKPLALTLADARDVVGAWRASRRTAMVGFSQRFHPLVRRARSVVREGRIGSVVAARFSTLSPPRDLPTWKRARADGGGALLDLASHQADLARFLFGQEVRDVAATARSIRTDDDDASMTMTMESGVHVDAHASFRTVRENRFEILGEEGRVVVDRVEGRMRLEPLEPPPGRVARARGLGRILRDALASPSGDPSYALALSAFVRAAREGSHPDPNPEDGERSLAIVIAAETAARDGRRTPVPPPTPT